MEIALKDDEKLLYSLRALYQGYGYRSFRMSKFEKYELYAGNKDFLVNDRVITFSDTNGDLLALKPDVTLSIVRSVKFRPGRKQKLYYHENVYRPAAGSGRFREIMQCGLECIGDLDSYDSYEVIALAERSLREISGESILSFSHLGILKSLLKALGAEEAEQAELLKLIAARSVHELAGLFERRGWDGEHLRELNELLALSCGLRELPEALRALGLRWLDKAVLGELEDLSRLAGEGDGIAQFDLSVINDIHYYNGVIFQGFVKGVSEKVLSGGRYDKLLERMGQKGGAIGFAVYLSLLEPLRPAPAEYDADVLLLYDRETPLTAIRDAIARLQARGKSVSAQRSGAEGRYRETVDLRGGAEHA